MTSIGDEGAVNRIHIGVRITPPIVCEGRVLLGYGRYLDARVQCSPVTGTCRGQCGSVEGSVDGPGPGEAEGKGSDERTCGCHGYDGNDDLEEGIIDGSIVLDTLGGVDVRIEGGPAAAVAGGRVARGWGGTGPRRAVVRRTLEVVRGALGSHARRCKLSWGC